MLMGHRLREIFILPCECKYEESKWGDFGDIPAPAKRAQWRHPTISLTIHCNPAVLTTCISAKYATHLPTCLLLPGIFFSTHLEFSTIPLIWIAPSHPSVFSFNFFPTDIAPPPGITPVRPMLWASLKASCTLDAPDIPLPWFDLQIIPYHRQD